MKNENSRKSISIMNTFIIMFSLVLAVTVSGLGYLTFSSWTSSAKNMVHSMANDMNRNIYNKIDLLMSTPIQINEVNHKIIENRILDLSNEAARERFFVGVLNAYNKEIYSFSFGTANGEYYGARRNENGTIEIMRNNSTTGGNSWYYSVNRDLTAGEIVLKAKAFDPRTRDWYKVAQKSKGPGFSPIYKHFVMDDLTVSASYPVYDHEKLIGVLGTHILLSDIGTYLEEIVLENQGYAFIVEKGTGDLIGNSTGAENFTVGADGSLLRNTLADINHPDIDQAYELYLKEHNTNFLFDGAKGNLYFSFNEYHQTGIEWVIITAVPESLLISEVYQNILLTVVLSIIAVLLSMVIYYSITTKLFKPMIGLLRVSDNIASGNFSDRVPIVRNDEIGKISEAFNKVADHLQYLIINLEDTVRSRTSELEDSKNQLQLILDSTAEAIFGIDLNGNFTFCNKSCYEMLGYSSQDDLLGKNMHQKIHHSHADGSPFPTTECRIVQSMLQGKGIYGGDEVFWRAGGTCFDAEYYAYPQKKYGKIIGAVVTFMDITERKKAEEEIKYLSCHDALTGLFNRRCFEEDLKKLDQPENLPLSIIFADVDSLKMTNDIFGHTAGDILIKESAEILQNSCGENDLIARTGGDEFIILMPNTSREEAERIQSSIKSSFDNTYVAAIKCSVSLGSGTKTSEEQDIDDVITEAEGIMYKNKVLTRKSTNSEILNTLVETLHLKSSREKQHAINVSKLCGELGASLCLSELEINKLIQAGYLHDIGKIAIEDDTLQKDTLKEAEREQMLQHVIIGYRILSLFDDTVDISEIVYSHHERWDGKGYPRGLKGDEIPLLSRIISVIERYERLFDIEDVSKANANAIRIINDESGSLFDPKIVQKFVEIIKKNE